jgi:hypothetical protein
MYGNNSNEHLPQPGWQMAVKNWAADANLPRPGAGGTVTTYNTYYPQQLDSFKKGQLYSYLQSPTLLLCPADILNANFYVRQQYLTSYCWNGAAVRFEGSTAQNDTVRFSDPDVRGNYILIW